MIGQTLSHYKVLEKIGQGGMGEVYRAEDTNLSREVAIKVLPEQFTKDPQRLARFEREAKLLASLNHPNIAAIYGFEEADDVRFLAMELVPGETLQERVAKGPVPVEEALEVCRQIAEGVEAAHEKGVIHRDLKPANVKVTPEGKVKILDFGLAKAFEDEVPAADISQSPTLTEEMTRAGVILGTAAYMSPEQAKGEPVDKRADIFAFGCVLYELLTSKRTFDGKTITETLGAIIHKEPDWVALPATTPWRIQELLRRCLTKDAHDRLRDIATVRIEIKLALEEPAAESPTGMVSAVQPARQRWGLTVGLVLLAVVVTGLAVWLLIQPSAPEQRLKKFVITPSLDVRITGGTTNELAISPDGRHFTYRADGESGTQLYLRSLDDFVDRPIPGTVGSVRSSFFSPDGESVAFFDAGSLKKVSLMGGSPITLCVATTPGQSGSWGPGGTIVFSAGAESGTGLYQVSAAGGEPELLAIPIVDQGQSRYFQPHILPDGENVLFSIRYSAGIPYQIAVLSLETKEQKTLLANGKQAHFLPTGHLVYELSETGNLMAVPFDLARLEVTGEPVPIVEGVRQNGGDFVDYAVSQEGTVVYVPDSGGLKTLVWVDRKGQEERLAAEPHEYQDPRISPDGSRLAITIVEAGGSDVWLYDLEREIPTRLTFDPADDHWPVWTPDSQRVVFDSTREGAPHNLFWKAADGTGQAQRLTTSPHTQGAYSFSPDGKSLVHNESSTSRNLHVLSMEGEFTSQPLLDSEFTENAASISPSGRFIAYESDESGQNEIYARPFPNVDGGKWQISRNGGIAPVWHPKEEGLFYRNRQSLMLVGIKTEPTFTAGSPAILFTGNYLADLQNRQYDISPDGQRFLMIKQEQTAEAQINVVLNWFEELKRLVPTGN